MIDRRLILLERKKAILQSREELIPFARYTAPDPRDRADPRASAYEVARHHRVIAAALEEVEAGRIKRLIISCPPRHGKTKLASILFPAWFAGRNPGKSVVFATYNDKYAIDTGGTVKTLMQGPLYRHIFPELKLSYGGAASDRLRIVGGGDMFFVGVGGTLTGRGGHINLIDDPIKNRVEADSIVVRDKLWNWYQSVLRTRLMTKDAALVIIACMTGDTPVLMADGAEKPLRDIRPGDAVATYRDGELSTSTVRNWRSSGLSKIFTLKTTSGIVVKANARHPFLVCENGAPKWIRVRDLRPGQEIFRVNGASGRAKLAHGRDAKSRLDAEDTATSITARNGGRMASGRHPILTQSANFISSAVTDLAQKIMSVCLPSRAANAVSAGALPTSLICPRDGAEGFASTTAMRLASSGGSSAITATWPLDTRAMRKTHWRSQHTSDFTLDRIAEITPTGSEEVFDIQVDETENFVANMLVSHNTRWNEDDLIGRHIDPANPHYTKEEAASWKMINLPALAEDDDPLGRPIDEPLWPARFDTKFLLDQRRSDPRGFTALYQGRPTPLDGSFFKASHILTYDKMTDLPRFDDMRFYGASDLAVASKQTNDRSCHLVAGVDANDNIWILPDIVWTRLTADVSIEVITNLMLKYKPAIWWAEKGVIQKSIGPFLRKRMLEKRAWCMIDEVSIVVDKEARAQSIRARMAMGKVFFPRFTRWFADAHDELLKFPHGNRDDFCDALSLVGLGIMKQQPAKLQPKIRPEIPEFTLAWVKENTKRAEREARRGNGGW